MSKENKPSQCQMIIDYINQFGAITPLEAMQHLGIMRLASRVSDLRKSGYIIIDEWAEVPNRYGGTTRVKRYRLAGEDYVL